MRVGSPHQGHIGAATGRQPLPSGEPLGSVSPFRSDPNAEMAGMAGFSSPNDSGITGAVDAITTPWLMPIGAWAWQDISTLSGAELNNGWMSNIAALLPQVVPGPGKLKTVSISLSADIGGVGVTVTATVYVNGIATALVVTLTGTAGTDTAASASLDVPVIATDKVTVFANKSGAVAAGVKICVTVSGQFQPS